MNSLKCVFASEKENTARKQRYREKARRADVAENRFSLQNVFSRWPVIEGHRNADMPTPVHTT